MGYNRWHVALLGLPRAQTGWLQQLKQQFLWFSRLEVQGWGVDKFGFFQDLSPGLVDVYILTVSSHEFSLGAGPWWLWVSKFPLL